jgi:hypothetical protein
VTGSSGSSRTRLVFFVVLMYREQFLAAESVVVAIRLRREVVS